MDVERIIDDIKQLQEMFEAPDIRPLSASDISAANRPHDEMLAHSPWFSVVELDSQGRSPVATITLTGTLRMLPLRNRDNKAETSASTLDRESPGMLSNSG